MKHIPAIPLTTHRCARFVAWGRMMLVWVWAMMFMEQRASRRHMRSGRYSMLDPHRLARYVGNLLYLRAAAYATRPPTHTRRHAPGGMRTKSRVESGVRAVRGSLVRKLLRHRDLRTRLSILMYVLDHLDAFARVMAPRLMRPLTRLRPILMTHAIPDALRSLAAPAPQSADSS